MKIGFNRINLVFCLLVVSQVLKAQTAAELVAEWRRAKTYTLHYLETMPENKYSFRPVAGMRSFAEQMLHLADANYGLGSMALGTQSAFKPGELEKKGEPTKSNVMKVVAASYDFIINHLKKANQQQFSDPVKMIGRFDMSRRIAVAKVFEHQTHHRGQTTIYLRLAGVKPPEEQLFN
ncbi:damage-inducible protein DinB [Pedobacter yulinensis]|uniref:Damage-inducible protein DinB n=1 Tax=Pedobacter yulinensis TaxID=2126353 RepID=A0A2T3HN74_9SPHI|nr:DinB family protein [Pedobacter yulinensis]PST83912.1 damage-inducible protein DinB [Pedobacter yulinensis]